MNESSDPGGDEPPNPWQDSPADEAGDCGIGVARWSSLEPHVRHEVLLEVAPELGLADVAQAMEADQVERVQVWLERGDLVKVTLERARELALRDRFEVRVVAPFVLCRALGQAQSD